MKQIIGFCFENSFSPKEVEEIFLLVKRITKKSSEKVRALISKLDMLNENEFVKAQKIEWEINHVIERWRNKLRTLGLKPREPWSVEINSNDGYYFWKYPNNNYEYFDNNLVENESLFVVEEEKKSYAEVINFKDIVNKNYRKTKVL